MADEVSIDVKLEGWSKELEVPKAELEKQFDEILKTACNGDRDVAIKKLYVAIKRKLRRIKDLVDFKGTILAISKPRDIAPFMENQDEELYVANVVGVLSDTNQRFKITLWGKDASRNDIPEQVDITFKALKRAEYANYIQLGGTDIEFEVLSRDEKRLVDFLEAMKPYCSTLANLEEYYKDNVVDSGDNLVMVKGLVFDKFNRPTKKGNYIITLDEDTKLGNENLLTTVTVPEKRMIELEPGDEVIVIGDCWKPKQTYDRTTREYIDAPARVQINAWNIEKVSGQVLRVSA